MRKLLAVLLTMLLIVGSGDSIYAAAGAQGENEVIVTVDKWSIESKINYIPFSPEGWDGQTIDNVVKDYTDQNGQTAPKTYTNVALLQRDDYSDYGQMSEEYITTPINEGKLILKMEYMNFLVHETSAGEESFYIDGNFNEYAPYILQHTDTRFLIEKGSSIFVYDINNKQMETITKECLRYKYPIKDNFKFIDWEHREFEVEWQKNSQIKETGEKVISYWNDNFEVEVIEEFRDNFETMQQALKKGEVKEEDLKVKYDVDIYPYGSIYRIDDEYMGNIHLPVPIKWNDNIILADHDSCWLVKENTLTLYHYGDIVCSYELPDGEWKIIEAYIHYHEDPNSSWLKYIIDTDNDNITTAKELRNAITNTNILMLNAKEHSVYTINQNGMVIKICEDVWDYREAYGQFYWMDSDYNAYRVAWMKEMKSTLIGKDVVGISQYNDERAGFLVKPDDTRCKYENDGFYFGEWLN